MHPKCIPHAAEDTPDADAKPDALKQDKKETISDINVMAETLAATAARRLGAVQRDGEHDVMAGEDDGTGGGDPCGTWTTIRIQRPAERYLSGEDRPNVSIKFLVPLPKVNRT
jgi:hypothetical protein